MEHAGLIHFFEVTLHSQQHHTQYNCHILLGSTRVLMQCLTEVMDRQLQQGYRRGAKKFHTH